MIVVGLLVSSFLVVAWVLVRAARLAGSSRARFRTGLGAAAAVLGIGTVSAVADAALPGMPSVGWTGVFLIAQLGVVFVALRRMFRVSSRRTLAPFGALIGVSLAQLALVSFVIRPHVLESFVSSAGGMTPTIEPGDRFIAVKFISPGRWDLVVYWGGPADEPQKYVKRLIGLPGERLRFDGGALFVNDKPVEAPAVLRGQFRAADGLSAARGTSRYGEGEDIVLGPNDFFFIGDHPQASADSRLSGPSDRAALIGVVDVVYWPIGRARLVRR